ncbi:DNA-binding response regulator [Streptomyces spectabilis]|nr:DNA-binding response regulator [Streptomyces spectabilis]
MPWDARERPAHRWIRALARVGHAYDKGRSPRASGSGTINELTVRLMNYGGAYGLEEGRMRLLLVEDDDHVAAALSAVLARHGFAVTHARNGEEALQALLPGEAAPFGVVLLDLGLPDQDGYEVCGKIRKRTRTPVIMVTARADVRSRIHGLNLGADDYVVKPYDTGELIARIHAVTRRPSAAEAAAAPAETELRLGNVRIELPTRQVSVDGAKVQLTRKEFDLLALLAQRPGVVFRREQIISEVWRTSWEGTGRTLEVHVASLRAKLHMPALIETVRGVGYRLVAPAA